MTAIDMQTERKKQRAVQRLGTDDPRCGTCGDSDWRCLELHHIGERAYDDRTVILCRNCHRNISDPHENQHAPDDPPLLDRVGHFLHGVAALLLTIAARMQGFADELLAAAQ